MMYSLYYLHAAPYHITQPSTDNDVQIVSPNATMLKLRCSLNVSIPADTMVTWLHSGNVLLTYTITAVTNTAQLSITGTPQPGIYQCVFNDSARYILRRNITVLGMAIYVAMCIDFYTCIHDYRLATFINARAKMYPITNI